jgi:hypothetical protein
MTESGTPRSHRMMGMVAIPLLTDVSKNFPLKLRFPAGVPTSRA